MLRLLLPPLCLILGLAPAAAGDAPRQKAPDLGVPARLEAVQDALRNSRDASREKMVLLASALGASGGHAAATGLTQLLGDRDDAVRLEALKATSRVGLRVEGLALKVRAALSTPHASAAQKLAAIEALGHVGGGYDFTSLLALASADTPSAEIRRASFRALAALSNAKLPLVHARWSYWWKTQRKRGPTLLSGALKALEADSNSALASRQEALVASHAWLDLARVEQSLGEWLRGSRPGLQATACRLASSLRLADLAPAIANLKGGLGGAETDAAARTALQALGYRHPEPLTTSSEPAR